MKATFFFIFLSIGIAQVFAAEEPVKQDGADARAGEAVQVSTGLHTDWVEVRYTPDIPTYQLEKLTKIMKAMQVPSDENMSMDVFLIERALWEGIKVNGGFWAKSTAKTVTALLSYIPLLSGNFLMRSVPLPVLSTYADKVTRGDAGNFPTLTLKYFVDLLIREDIKDRASFEKLPAGKRSFDFETDEFNGLGKGYKGRLFLMDFVCGTPLETGGINSVISQYGDKVLDHLVSVKAKETPLELIRTYFGDSSPAQFTKVGQVWKNNGLFTCTLYELNVSSFSIYVHGMRVPEIEYLERVKWWKEVFRLQHEAVLVNSGQMIENSDAPTK